MLKRSVTMSRKVLIPVLIAVVAAAVTVGVLASRAQGSATLPAVTPSQLLSDMATKAPDTTSISGDVAWTNDLIGDTSALNFGGATTPTGIASLLQGGKGRIWLQDGKVRLESQGQGGDLVVTAANGSVWAYSSAANTATQYVLPAGAGGTMSPTSAPSAATAQIEQELQELAPTATMAVSGQENVAGQQAYILTMTPTAANTTLGSVEVAIDGKTFVPLRIEVFPKGSTSAALSGGFTSVSYASIDGKLFEFTPPEGTKVVKKTVNVPAGLGAEKTGTAEGTQSSAGQALKSEHEMKPLTLAQAQQKAGFTLAEPQGSTLAFTGAAVMPAENGGSPTVVLQYGKGFGSVMLVETQATADQAAGLEKQLAQLAKVQIVQPTMVNGSPGLALSTSLFNVVAWQQGKLMVAAAGMVPQSDLSAFAGSVR
jgi:outer membrane lipoprotein-sorting protein